MQPDKIFIQSIEVKPANLDRWLSCLEKEFHVFQRRPEQSDESLRASILENVVEKGSENQKRAQLFGQPVRDFGSFGQLRKQKKAPKLEVLYIQVETSPKFPIGGSDTSRTISVWRSINNATNTELTESVKGIALGLEQGQITTADAEFLLDTIYHEIGRRV